MDKNYICEICGKQFNTLQKYKTHVNVCKHDQHLKDFTFICKKCGKEYTLHISQSAVDKGKYSKFCSRSCANSRIHSNETKAKISNSINTKLANGEVWGCLNPLNFTYKVRVCPVCGKEFTINEHNDDIPKFSKFCSLECKTEWKNKFYKTLGGFRGKGGRGKSGWYKGIYCDSSWELAFVIYNLEHGIEIERCKERRKYIFNNEEHEYVPDFVIDGKIYEIKGQVTDQWLEKIKQNSDITVLYKNDMKMYIDYCTDKYGKNFISLYEK